MIEYNDDSNMYIHRVDVSMMQDARIYTHAYLHICTYTLPAFEIRRDYMHGTRSYSRSETARTRAGGTSFIGSLERMSCPSRLSASTCL